VLGASLASTMMVPSVSADIATLRAGMKARFQRT
jgi:hypothetical protein